MRLFDSHAHYQDEKFEEDRKEILEQIRESGIEKVTIAGYNIEASKQAASLAQEYDFIYATVGISPNDIPTTQDELDSQIQEIVKLSNQENVVAVGEIGLDYYWNQENKELQKQAFIKQIQIANEAKLPIVIHTREAVNDTIKIVKENTVIQKGIFHCCPMNRELIKEALALGFYISFAGPITFKNASNAREVIQMVPIEKMLIETDSPYLSPEPNRGKRNDSRNVYYMAKKIAEVKNVSIEEVAETTYQNACEIFKIKK